MKNSLIFKFLCFMAFFAVSAYVAWSWFFETGLYATLIRLQIEHLDGGYYPTHTGIGLWIALLMPLSWLGLSKQPKDPGPPSSAKSTAIWCLLMVTLFGAGGATTYYLSLSAPGEDQPALIIEDINQLPDQSLWFKKVSLKGIPATEIMVTIEEQATERSEHYIPILASEEGTEPVKFIATRRGLQRANTDLLLTGFVRPTVLPIFARDSFEQSGITLDDTVYLISNDIPALQNIYWIATAILLIIAIIILITMPIVIIQNRRAIKMQEASA